MYVDLSCRCDSGLQIDAEDEDAVWSLVWRFTSSHVVCGYVTAGRSDEVDSEPRKVIARPRRET